MSKIYDVIISVGEVYKIEADSEEQAENFLRNANKSCVCLPQLQSKLDQTGIGFAFEQKISIVEENNVSLAKHMCRKILKLSSETN